ncbi:hypothetical protein EJB05_15368, partial [Eragrostis curvula]
MRTRPWRQSSAHQSRLPIAGGEQGEATVETKRGLECNMLCTKPRSSGVRWYLQYLRRNTGSERRRHQRLQTREAQRRSAGSSGGTRRMISPTISIGSSGGWRGGGAMGSSEHGNGELGNGIELCQKTGHLKHGPKFYYAQTYLADGDTIKAA